ncbi:Peter Pan-like protein [Porphyridium purpureum]|uniref:Peter Pan-like protein n=1 Tax=Porphyridium purpureum TaxID=35688 RepID=A0A5J4YXN2_PORPP|nr:Peter Pan-like protein [Porphyridium purpureum]|eukprot:POR9712..scf209_3
MPQKRGRRRKTRTHVRAVEEGGSDGVPRSFVVRRGAVPHGVKALIGELRQAFMPHTAAHLRERRSNSLKDFEAVAGKLGVTHMWMFSATDWGVYARMIRLPRGPTLTFRLQEYSLSADIKALQRRPASLVSDDLREPPLLVLNHFSAELPHVRIARAALENMFPKIDVRTCVLSRIRRVLLVDYDDENTRLHFRHYKILIQPVGLSRTVRKLVVRHKVPKLTGMSDISELVNGDGDGHFLESSESEGEGPQEAHVTLPQNVGKKRKQGGRNTIKLVEEGPRLSLDLVKIEDGVCAGEVLFHSRIHLDDANAEQKAAEAREKRKIKETRRALQEKAVHEKKQHAEEKQEKKRKRREARERERDQ